MNVLIAGGHGRTARIVARLLIEGGRGVTGIVRRESHRRALQALGAAVFVVDVTNGDLSRALKGIDAVVFAAAGGSGEHDRVDHRGAAHVAEGAEAVGVRRFVLLSANGAHDPHSWGPAYAEYLGAKRSGEDAVAVRNLDWTVVRPAALTDGGGTGMITLRTTPGGTGSISREDLARTLTAVLVHDNTIGKTLEVWSGPVPIGDAVAAV